MKTNANIVPFNKYEKFGAYHWDECRRSYLNLKRYNPALHARYKLITAFAKKEPRGAALDIGCGDGYLMAQIAPFMNDVLGVDSEAKAIELAKGKLSAFKNCKLIHTSSYELPFSEGTFDLALSADVIEHLVHPDFHLQEINRILKPIGKLFLTTPKWRNDRMWDTRHEKEYRAEEMYQLLAKYFQKVQLFYFWPLIWSQMYSTKVGWYFLKFFSILFYNPFYAKSAGDSQKYGQIFAICEIPKKENQKP